MRELSSSSDTTAAVGKMAAELDHVRGKEALAREALRRSERERLELERTSRGLRQQVTSLGARLVASQDHAWCVRRFIIISHTVIIAPHWSSAL